MNRQAECLGEADLERLVREPLPDEEAAVLAGHLEGCSSCARAAEALLRGDAMEAAMRRGSGPDGATPPPEARELMGRLKELVWTTIGEQTATSNVATTPPGGEEGWGFLAPPERPDELGRLGPYRVLAVLGRGGMGVVFRAEDPHLERQVALKAMLPALAASPSAKARFLREAKAAAALRHDHVVSVYHVGEERGVPYLAMELLDGEPLEERLRRDGRRPASEVLRVGKEIAEGLAAAHAKGLIHRDIKPANVWIEERTGRAKILDFGLARPAGDGANLTQQGAIVGTPAYMAPEQARGEAVGGRADLFSLGCVLYRMATGSAPFQGKDAVSTLLAVAMETPRPPDDSVPRPLAGLIVQMLEKEPGGRPASANEVAEAMAAMGGASAGERTATVLAAPRPPRRRGWASAVAGLALLGGAACLGVVLLRTPTPDGKGSLVVETDDPAVKVIVRQGGVTLFDGTTKREFDLKVGDYEIELSEGQGGLRLSTKSFTIVGGGKERVRVYLDRPKAKAAPAAGPSLFDKLRRENLPPGSPAEAVAVIGEPRDNAFVQYVGVGVGGRVFMLVRDDVPTHPSRLVSYDAAGKPGPGVPWAGHNGYLSAAVSPDGRLLATAMERGFEVNVYDVATRKPLATFNLGSGGTTGHLAFSGDGKRLALITGRSRQEGTVKVYDSETGRLALDLAGRIEGAGSLAISADGERLAVGLKGEMKVLDAANGKELASFPSRSGVIRDPAFSPDGSRLAVPDEGAVRLYDGRTGAALSRIESGTTLQAAFSPDGSRLATWGRRNKRAEVAVWEVARGKQLLRWDLPGDKQAVAFAPEGRHLLVGAPRATVYVLRLAEAAAASPFDSLRRDDIPPYELAEAGGGDAARAPAQLVAVYGSNRLSAGPRPSVAWGGDGSALFTASLSGLSFWDAAIGDRRHALQGKYRDIAASADGGRLAAACDDQVCLHDPRTARLLRSSNPHGREVVALSLSADGKRVASAALLADGRWECRVREADSDKVLAVVTGDATEADLRLALSPDGSRLAVAAADGEKASPVRVWEVGAKKEPLSLPLPEGSATDLVFSADGKRLAAAVGRGWVRVFDPVTGEQVERHPAPGVTAVAYGAGGRLAYATREAVYLRDAKQPEVRKPVSWARRQVVRMAFSPDGSRLACALHNGTVQMLDAAPDAVPPEEAGPTGSVKSVAVSRDGRRVAAATSSGAIWVRDPAGRTVVTLTEPGSVENVDLSPDGKRLLVHRRSGREHGVRLRDIEKGVALWRVPVPTYSRAWFSHDGRRVVTVQKDEVWLIDAETGQKSVVLKGLGGPGAYRGAALSPDGGTLVANSDGDILVCDAATGKVRHTIKDRRVWPRSFSPDGTLLLVDARREGGGALEVVNAATGEVERRLSDVQFKTAAYGPDGSRVAALRGGEELTVWDAATTRVLDQIRAPAKGLFRDFTFAPDGRHLLTANADGTVWVLRLSARPAR